ncbi:Mitochondrial elongation factor G [Perkinsela sp. CCAP 1560/4]|nr:Mitochondrial elongation factor G [Perkinsela sp. CCAP 1560/4]|eukprot:KNH07383.1 Mitochondrial elongation factor G [Perkinsela sp. CCAP 1560/4]
MFVASVLNRLTPQHAQNLLNIRNIGISAHIDHGKTTLSERILFYSGKIKAMHEVKGSSDIGATMDSMELEKERGITIRSAATYCKWKTSQINLIDTPGHVDFTIEVERALRVLDGAILVICAVNGVQTQTITVDRQMRRYAVPRMIFINKMDRDGANSKRVIDLARSKLNLKCAPIQLPIGEMHEFEGVIDVIEKRAIYFDGAFGETVRVEGSVPAFLAQRVEEAYEELFTTLADVDSEMEDLFLNDRRPTSAQMHAAVRRTVIANQFIPVLMGTAYKNKGVQVLLDAVERYLPNPTERVNVAHAFTETQVEDRVERVKGESVTLQNDDEKPLVAFTYKIEETRGLGLSNYIRIYQGRVRKGDTLLNVRTGRSFSVAKLVRMHANSAVAVNEILCGDICAIVGELELASGDTVVRNVPPQSPLWAGNIGLENMYVPPPVMSLSVKAKDQKDQTLMEKKMQNFQREDPTLRIVVNPETREFVIQGMGELHLEIYLERLRREYDVDTTVGKPTVNYREIIQERVEFDFTHKRQSGGAGQYAHVKGYIEPMKIDLTTDTGDKNEYKSTCKADEVTENLQKSFQNYFLRTVFGNGPMIDAPLWGVRVVLESGTMHEVDSKDIAFKNAAKYMFAEYFPKCAPTLIEPWMAVDISSPQKALNEVLSEFVQRGGLTMETKVDNFEAVILGEAPLSAMFGFINKLRSLTKGEGAFSLEFKEYRPMSTHDAQKVMDERNAILERKVDFQL